MAHICEQVREAQQGVQAGDGPPVPYLFAILGDSVAQSEVIGLMRPGVSVPETGAFC